MATAVEDRRVLPGLAAVGDGDLAGVLDLLQRRRSSSQVVRLGDAELVEHRLVRPDPVGRVHVDRRRDPLAVVLGELLQRLGITLSQPSFSAIGVRSASTPCFAQSLDVEAEHLHRGRRIARGTRAPAARSSPGCRRRRRPACPASRCPASARFCFSTFSAAASPPEVHQCRTSTSSAARALAEPSARPSGGSAGRAVPFRQHAHSSLLQPMPRSTLTVRGPPKAPCAADPQLHGLDLEEFARARSGRARARARSPVPAERQLGEAVHPPC